MRFALALAALVGLAAASPKPQGVATTLAPESTPQGCAPTYDGGNGFQISIVNASTAAKVKRQGLDPNSVPGNALILTLQDGQLLDQSGRVGYIAANRQLQFDNPIQAGALITTGFSACPNGTLALTSAVWYQCLSGDFYNLYDESQGPQCSQAYLDIIGGSDAPDITTTPSTPSPTASSTPSSTPAPSVSTVPVPVTQVTDGQPQATTGAPTVVTQVTDGQIQAPSTVSTIVTQITDGQIQAPTNGTTPLPYNPNAAASVAISGTFMAVVAGAIGLGALVL